MSQKRGSTRILANLLDLFLAQCVKASGKFLELCLVNRLDKLVSLEKGQLRAAAITGRLKRGRQIATHRASPSCNVGFLDLLAGPMRQKFFEKLQDRCMVENLRTNTSSTAPRRGNNHGDAIAQSNGALASLPDRLVFSVLFQFDEFDSSVDASGHAPGFWAARVWRREWRDMIEVTVVLVIRQDEDSLFPDIGILRQYVHDFRDVPCSIPGGRRVVGKLLWTDDPGNSREVSAVDVFAILEKEVAALHFHLECFVAVAIGEVNELSIVRIIDICAKGSSVETLFAWRQLVKTLGSKLPALLLVFSELVFEFGNAFLGFLRCIPGLLRQLLLKRLNLVWDRLDSRFDKRSVSRGVANLKLQ